ncbi:MAG TPA: hypothetical protein VMC79_05295 [Rectinemataceae bacterium]|nr:hypothetical protein [Rectinemataceae bacterium]
MKVLYCDVCKKQVDNPIPTRTFFHIADIDICEPCKDDLEAAVKYTVRGKKPFDYAWYDEMTMKILRDSVQRGKINIPARPTARR